jgi:quinol monooxygenase YgiN
MVHVVARFLAKPGQEEALGRVLAVLVAPTRREPGCHQYDLLSNPGNPADLCFVERWESDDALDRHLETAHVQRALAESAGLISVPVDVRRYREV